MPEKSKQRSFEAWLPVISGQDTTLRATLQRGALYGLAGMYRLGLWVRNQRWKRAGAVHRTSVPVISVGNLTTGGTGKTPFVKWLCRVLRQRELRVAILSRGYQTTDRGVNDEALELELSLPDVPHLQDPDRRKIAEIAVEELESQCLVLDDGFQHRQLHRNLDIVLIDATCPLGYGYTLPRGLLREPLSALRRGDVLVLTRCNQVPAQELTALTKQLEQYRRDATVPICQTVHQPTDLSDSRRRQRPLHELSNKKLLAFAGVGNPAAFFQTLRDLGHQLVATKVFPDHHPYAQEDVQQLRDWIHATCGNQADDSNGETDLGSWRVVTTQKDLVKLNVAQLAGVELVAVGIEITFLSGQSQLLERLNEAIDLVQKPGLG